jgi:dipeptidase E
MSGGRPTRLLALGGGGFTTSIQDLPLDRFPLDLCGADAPRVCLLPTAGGDAQHQIDRFYSVYRDTPAELSHVSLFRLGLRPPELRRHLLAQDVIYAGGGSLVNLLALWRAHEIDQVLAEAWRSGTVLCGVSAGAMCWFEGGVTRGFGGPLPARGLGLVRGSLSVHDDVDPQRAAAHRLAVSSGALPPGHAIDDGAALLFEDGVATSALTARPRARARRVWTQDGCLEQEPIEAELLDQPPAAVVPEHSVAELRELRRARPAGLRRGA